jgi:DNA topoisomerase-1
MTKTLVIVESPAKAKTIKKYLGTGFDVIASKGHLKDLPKSQNAVDVAKDFTEKYEVIEGKEKILEELKAAAKKADTVLLATDPDREGEAIAFHISEEIKDDKLKVSRVEFHEITKRGIDHGVSHPRALDAHLYDAQRARRVLDRIVGYDVSALVWSKLAFGLSAGRVQSVALRLITDREKEIEAFVPQEYWNVAVTLSAPSGASFGAKLAGASGEKIEVTNGAQAAKVKADLEGAKFKVAKVTKREQKRNPPAPYTTSKLQQDATNLLHFGAKRTMQIAQGLYEGVDLKQDGDSKALWQSVCSGQTERLQDEEKRARCARSDTSDKRQCASGLDQEAPEGRAVQTVQAHLEQIRCFSNDSGRVRPNDGGDSSDADGNSSAASRILAARYRSRAQGERLARSDRRSTRVCGR